MNKINHTEISDAATKLSEGKLVALPTETVYGLGGDAENAEAIADIFVTKGRPSNNPLIVHVANKAIAERYVLWNDMAGKLSDAFHPGPLTLVLPLKPDAPLAPAITAGHNSVAIRIPAHPIAMALLTEFGRGIAAPSANRSGRISPTRPQHVAAEFAGRALQPAIILDGGATDEGLESSIVDCSTEPPRLLRAGTLTFDELAAIIPSLTHTNTTNNISPNAPGMLTSHYAPNAQIRLNALEPHKGEAYLAFGETCSSKKLAIAAKCLNLSSSGDIKEAAHNLFDALRTADALGVNTIAIAPIPHQGIGIAINDRLARAAAPRKKAHE